MGWIPPAMGRLMRWTEDQLKAYQSRGAVAQPATKAAVRPRQLPGQMNKTEARYLADVIEPGIAAGKYRSWRFESLKFKLADKTFYTPDFQVINAHTGEIELHEIKGGRIEDDAMVKFKVAAAQYPEYRWLLQQQKNTKAPWVTLLDK
jgi:hypothetical protein